MDQRLAEKFSQQLKIALEHVVREEYELLILRNLMESALGKALVFKGGTALRLAYDSPRFSDATFRSSPLCQTRSLSA